MHDKIFKIFKKVIELYLKDQRTAGGNTISELNFLQSFINKKHDTGEKLTYWSTESYRKSRYTLTQLIFL